jgi:hypothetical protein
MGAIFSTLMLLGGSIVTGVISALAARAAKVRDYAKLKMLAGVCIATAVILTAVALFFVIKSHSAGAEVAVGMSLSLIVLEIFSLIDGIKAVGPGAEKFSIGASIASFASFVLALIIIVFLL